jgi:hypothetical protein
MTATSRRKGARRERECARLLGSQRMPLSGAAGGAFAGDVLSPALGWVEVKARAAGFALLYRWLAQADALALRADRQEWLVVLPLPRLLALLEGVGDALRSEPGAKP